VATVAVICGECGVTLFRHPAMRNQRVVCFACQKKRKNEARRKQREAELKNRTFTSEPDT
jgi:uncharacterized Zn finger protein (UPF0148 family)